MKQQQNTMHVGAVWKCWLLLLLLLLLYTVTATAAHQLAKRMMDLQVCLAHFDVHQNTIIRTGESQAIGGKYLQGFELQTPEECRRLCCETDACDVYVFEAKHDGYCYLFECGPQENFHCKFTRHANYTSALLTASRLQPQQATFVTIGGGGGGGGAAAGVPDVMTMGGAAAAVPSVAAATSTSSTTTTTTSTTTTTTTTTTTPQPQPAVMQMPLNNISQQEWELSNLKMRPIGGSGGNVLAAAAPSLPQNGDGGITRSDAMLNVAAASNNGNVCGRFQFSCHSGECIAVYNACDGIPQCEDGSDEGPECTNTNAAGVATRPKLVDDGASGGGMRTLPHYTALQQPPAQGLAPENAAAYNNREDAGAWANRKMISNKGDSSDELNRHIFNHKSGLQLSSGGVGGIGGGSSGGSVYMPSNGGFPPPAVYAANNEPQWAGNDGAAAYLPPAVMRPAVAAAPQAPPPAANVWVTGERQNAALAATAQQQLQKTAYMYNVAPPQVQPRVEAKAMVAVAPPPPPPPPAIPPAVDKNAQDVKAAVGAPPTANKADAAAAQAVDEYEAYDEDDQSTEPPKKKTRKHKKLKATAAKHASDMPQPQQQQQQQPPHAINHEQYKAFRDSLTLEYRDHDGEAERPGGAVLSLTLGVCVTVALAILIGCRMRTIRRRPRRNGGKAGYGHEADFLVNGMYL